MGSQTSKGSINANSQNSKHQAVSIPFSTYVQSNSTSANHNSQRNLKTSMESRADKPNDNVNYVNTMFKWNYEGSEVYVTGTFTAWLDHIKLQKNGNEFSVILPLPKAIHRYKFIVDDEWRFSPDDNNSPDENGNINNIIDTTDYSIQRSFQGFYQGQSLINTSLRLLINPGSIIRGTHSIDQRNSSETSCHLTKFLEDEIEFVKDAPLIPHQLLDIYFLSEKDKKTKEGWCRENENMEMELGDKRKKEQLNQHKDEKDGIFRALESFNSLSPPSHVILNHLGVCKQNNEESYFVYVITERFKAKYVTMKFYIAAQAK